MQYVSGTESSLLIFCVAKTLLLVHTQFPVFLAADPPALGSFCRIQQEKKKKLSQVELLLWQPDFFLLLSETVFLCPEAVMWYFSAGLHY